MRVDMETEGLEELLGVLHAFSPRMRRRAVRPAMAKIGRRIAKRARELAPVDSGSLKKSIGSVVRNYKENVVAVVGPRADEKFHQKTIRIGGRRFRVKLKSTQRRRRGGEKETELEPHKYGYNVEHGTRRSRPRPFLRPAMRQESTITETILALHIRKFIQDHSRSVLSVSSVVHHSSWFFIPSW